MPSASEIYLQRMWLLLQAGLPMAPGGATEATLAAAKADLDTMLLGIVLAAGENHIGMVSGQGASVSTEITRPNDTTAYAINDVVGPTGGAALLTFTNIARVNAGTGYIVKVRLMTDQKTNTATYRLHLYSDNTPTAIADNALFTLLWANRAVRVGYIDLYGMGTEDPTGSDCAVAFSGDIRLHFKSAAASRNLYGVLETKTVFTPAASQKFFIELETELD